MIYDIHAQEGESRRMLAVIAERSERANEIAEQFAKLGEAVETLWYADSRQLLAESLTSRFQAVILFASPDAAATAADELALRDALTDTPLYLVA